MEENGRIDGREWKTCCRLAVRAATSWAFFWASSSTSLLWLARAPFSSFSSLHTQQHHYSFTSVVAVFFSLNKDPDPGFLAATNLGQDLAFWWELFKAFYLFLSSVAYPWNFYYGSGSADPCLWLMDLDPDSNSDPDPAISSLIFKMPTKN